MKMFFLINVMVLWFSCMGFTLYGQETVKTGDEIKNVSQMIKLWDSLYKKYPPPPRSRSIPPAYSYFMNYIKNMTEADRIAVLNDAFSRPWVDSIDDDVFVISRFLIYYTNEKNEEKVIEILSKKCPSLVYLEPIEYYLAHTSKFQYPMMLLFKGYDKSKDATNRNIIVAAVLSAFRNFEIEGKGQFIESHVSPRYLSEEFMRGGNKELFMKNAKIWYEENKDKIMVDKRYGIDYPDEVIENGKIVPVYLFKYKP